MEELGWARTVLRRAYVAPEVADGFRTTQSIVPWHEAIAVARALAADVRAGTGDADAAGWLLALVGNSLEVVALAAFQECCRLWPTNPRLAWSAFPGAFSLCRVGPRPGRGTVRPGPRPR